MAGADPDLDGRVGLVTGGANGIGAGIVRRLAHHGADVVVADVDDAAGLAIADEVSGSYVRCDVREIDALRAAVGRALDRHGRLDVVALNAGVASRLDLDDPDGFDLERYRLAMGVNLDGVILGALAARPALRKHGGGDIIATASLAGLTGVPPDPVYAANKHGVVGFVRSVGSAWPQEGIRVNAVCPGFTETAIISPDEREMLDVIGLPLLEIDDVVDAFMAALTSGSSGTCWYVQPGRSSEPFRFPNLPGPRTG